MPYNYKEELNKKYHIVYNGKEYVLFEGDKPVLTPRGKQLATNRYDIAKRLQKDAEEYGLRYTGSESTIPWQLTYNENFFMLGKKATASIIKNSFLRKPDWTYSNNEKIFSKMIGTQFIRELEITKWLDQCDLLQLTATCCIGNAYESINVAYMMARLIENGDEAKSNNFYEWLCEYNVFESEKAHHDFETFKLYYSIGKKEPNPTFVDGMKEKVYLLTNTANKSDVINEYLKIMNIAIANKVVPYRHVPYFDYDAYQDSLGTLNAVISATESFCFKNGYSFQTTYSLLFIWCIYAGVGVKCLLRKGYTNNFNSKLLGSKGIEYLDENVLDLLSIKHAQNQLTFEGERFQTIANSIDISLINDSNKRTNAVSLLCRAMFAFGITYYYEMIQCKELTRFTVKAIEDGNSKAGNTTTKDARKNVVGVEHNCENENKKKKIVMTEQDCEKYYKKAYEIAKSPDEYKTKTAFATMSALALNENYIPAIVWLAEYNESVLSNFKEAANLYKKAADLGDGESARCYADIMMAMRRNQDEAKKYYAMATEKGVPEAAFVYSQMLLESGDKESARIFAQKALDEGYEPAEVLLEKIEKENCT